MYCCWARRDELTVKRKGKKKGRRGDENEGGKSKVGRGLLEKLSCGVVYG